MTEFERMRRRRKVRCDICGGPVFFMFGGGWDNDRVICGDESCGAEIVFSTTTEIDEKQKGKNDIFSQPVHRDT